MIYTTGQTLRIPMGTQRRAVTATCFQNETRYYRFDIGAIRPAYVWYSEAQLAKLNPLPKLPGLTDFLAALAQFADTSTTCPGCQVEQPEGAGCGDCGRCSDCCTCYEAEPEVKYRDCLDWRSELYYSLIRL